MLNHSTSQKHKYSGERAQAIAEFAIVLPILMVILVGILEVGRMIYIYAAVNNASREAVRYASAVGLNDSGTLVKYNDCNGIRNMATRTAFFIPLTITIYRDQGVTNATPPVPINQTVYCSGASDTVKIPSGDRVTVRVSTTYRPMVTLIPIGQRPINSTSSRTVLGILELSSP